MASPVVADFFYCERWPALITVCSMSKWLARVRWLALVPVVAGATLAHAQSSFLNFESGHVRPLALSPGGDQLFAVNTPDNRLEIYRITAGGLTLDAEVPVGLEPVSVATRTNAAGHTEAWVVNFLSDSVSIVDVNPSVALSHVTKTLLVGDEPRDIVFGGTAHNRAFITCAHRGQNRPGDPQVTSPGVGRADVWVFDASGTAIQGSPLTLFGDTPRALAVSPNGATVYAAAFNSGNRTTTIPELVVGNTQNNPHGLPPPPPSSTPGAPDTGLIVKFNGSAWVDEINRDWSAFVPFSLPDDDVFLIDADASQFGTSSVTGLVTGVGTVIFNMAVRPNNGKVYVTNTDALNQVRFEPFVRGHLAESRITVISGTTATPHHLNPHINYGVVPGPQTEIDRSLAFPTDLTFSADGNTVFVTGFGSGKIGAFNAGDLESGVITEQQTAVGRGPSGIVLDVPNNRLYVMNRIDHTISIIGNASSPSRAVIGSPVPLRFDPSPAAAKNGRRFLYDATKSAHGDSACASCHISGDFDGLAWDLGDPFGTVTNNPNPFRLQISSNHTFHPMKGPMTTQSLRGMANAGPMHWRGDRTAGNDPGGQPLDEDGAFKKFNPAFVGLLGASSQLSTTDMQAYTDFILTVRYPPNPIRSLDNSLTSAQSNGQTFYFNTTVDTQKCNTCHALDIPNGFFGTDGFSSFEGEMQEFKIPHLRNLYQKIGMFGFPNGAPGITGTGPVGPQVRGFGFLHDGAISTVFIFLHAQVFTFQTDTQRRNVEAFVLSMDTGLRPIVGQQMSLTPATVNDTTVTGRIDLLIARDDAGDCDLVVKGIINGEARGAVYVGNNNFQPDRNSDAVISKTALRNLAAANGQEQVYTCVPPGSGIRIGVDRDLDGFFDRTELDQGTNPADPASFPGAGSTTTTTTSTTTSTTVTTTTIPVVLISTRSLTLRDDNVAPVALSHRKISYHSATKLDAAANRIVVPPGGSSGDPRGAAGATLTVYNSNPVPGSPTDDYVIALPSTGWTALGAGTVTGYLFRGTDPNGPISRITVKADSITIRGGRANWPYTLNEPSQGRVALRLKLGNATPWCADVPAKVGGNPPSTAHNDTQDKFFGQPKTPPPAACPVPK